MKNQIFKTPIMPELLWGFLKENAEELETHFRFNKTHYKKTVYTNKIVPFIISIKDHYHESKKHFILRKMDYIKFITVLRQIAKSIDVRYTNELSYDKSNYEIVYCFYK
jgi:hypothetical protein